MSLSDVIEALGADTYQVTRTAVGSRVQGRYVPGAETTFDIVAGAEPLSGRELMDTAQGQRGDEVVTIYTATPIVGPPRPGAPDVIRYFGTNPNLLILMGSGEPWTVTKVDVLDGLDGAHYEVQAARTPSPVGAVP